MKTAGIKDLKNRLSYYLREVKKGEKILITDRDQVIATILLVGRGEADSSVQKMRLIIEISKVQKQTCPLSKPAVNKCVKGSVNHSVS